MGGTQDRYLHNLERQFEYRDRTLFSVWQEVIWTLLCLADDDPLCKGAVRISGALPLLVPVLGLAPFSTPINGFMGLPALAARALRVLGEGESCKEAEEQLQISDALDDSLKSVRACVHEQTSEEEEQWQVAAVPHLARLLMTVEEGPKGSSKQGFAALPRQSSLSAGQKQSKLLFSWSLLSFCVS